MLNRGFSHCQFTVNVQNIQLGREKDKRSNAPTSLHFLPFFVFLKVLAKADIAELILLLPNFGFYFFTGQTVHPSHPSFSFQKNLTISRYLLLKIWFPKIVF